MGRKTSVVRTLRSFSFYVKVGAGACLPVSYACLSPKIGGFPYLPLLLSPESPRIALAWPLSGFWAEELQGGGTESRILLHSCHNGLPVCRLAAFRQAAQVAMWQVMAISDFLGGKLCTACITCTMCTVWYNVHARRGVYMSDKGDKVAVRVEVDRETHRRLKVKAAQEEIPLQALLERIMVLATTPGIDVSKSKAEAASEIGG